MVEYSNIYPDSNIFTFSKSNSPLYTQYHELTETLTTLHSFEDAKKDAKSMRKSSKYKKDFNDEDFARQYARRHKKMADSFGREYAEKLSSRGFTSGRIIDLGCGFGGTNIVLAKEFPDSEVIGIDLSEPLLSVAKQSAKGAGLDERIKFEKADVHNIPYGDNYFDVVLNINMLHLVENPIKMLNEIERILKPDGFLFIADIRYSWVGIIEGEFKLALALDKAKELLRESNLRDGTISSSFLWWRFET